MEQLSEIGREAEDRFVQAEPDIHIFGVEPVANLDPAMPDARRDQSRSGIHAERVASSSPYAVARKRRRRGHCSPENHSRVASSSPIPAQPEDRPGQSTSDDRSRLVGTALQSNSGDAGRESGHTIGDDRRPRAALANFPAQPESLLDQSRPDVQRGTVEEAPYSDPTQVGTGDSQRSRESQRRHASPVEHHAGPQGESPAGVGRSGRRRPVAPVGDSESCASRTRRDAPARDRKAKAERSPVDQAPCVDHSRVVGGATSSDPALPEGEIGRLEPDNQSRDVGLATSSQFGGNAEDLARHEPNETHSSRACGVINPEIPGNGEGGVDHACPDNQTGGVDPAIINEIREQWRRRQAWHRAEKSLTLQAKALCRRLATDGDKTEADVIYRAAMGEGSHSLSDVALAAIFPLTQARDGVEQHRKKVESRLRKLARQLPVAKWVESIPGASLNSLAAIVGEAGDLSVYGNPAKLWKRMGLAVMPDGTRQRRVGGDEALEHGYSPARRSVVWNIGGSLIGGMGRGPRLEPGGEPESRNDLSPLQRVFVKRCRFEVEKDPTHARPVSKSGKESFSKHAAARAKRYVEKRFLLFLWREWRQAILT